MRSGRLRMLVVDDQESWRYSVRELFARRAEIEITEAVSGGDAVDKIRAEDYDLALLDMRMPAGTEGLDALREIKEIKPQTSVVIVTAYGDTRKIVEAMKRGAWDFVDKGADFGELIVFKVNEFLRTFDLIADRERLIQAKYEEAMRVSDKRLRGKAKTAESHRKGKALEELLAALFSSVDGFIVTGRNVTTADEEIDVLLRNESRDPFWQKQSAFLLTECKNWLAQRVGKKEFGDFEKKMENRYGQCQLSFLICTEKFADTIEKEMLRSSRGNLLIVPIDGDGLRELVESPRRGETLKGFVQRAVLT